jgi:hypothetical protein
VDLRSVLSKFLGSYRPILGCCFMLRSDLLFVAVLVLLIVVVAAYRCKSSERAVEDNVSRRERAWYPDF